MKKASLLFRAVLCLILAQSCNPEFEPKESENRTEETNSSVSERRLTASEFIEQVKVEVQPTAKPEKYMVYFSWPKLIDSQKLRIRIEQVLSITKPEQVTFSHEVNHNQTLTYNFDLIGSDNLTEKSFSKLVKIPRDFVVRPGQDNILESSKIVVNRFFISKDNPLTTNGHDLEIVTNLFSSEGGIIQTFPAGSKANLDMDGSSGGNLVLKSETARGDLKVFMRGQNGGDGSKGPAHPSRAKDGTSAGSGHLFCECTGKNCLVSKIDFKNLKQTNSIDLENGFSVPLGSHCSCDPMGQNATAGDSGTKGNKGNPARAGGNSGQLKVLINDGREFFIQTESNFGVAGSPGEGGDGQPGGLGGSGKRENKNRDCRGWAAGDGSPGPKGDPGDFSINGQTEMTCIYIASENRNDCY